MNRRRPVQIREKGNDLILKNRWLTVDYSLENGHWNAVLSHGGSFQGVRFSARAQVNGQWIDTGGTPVERWEQEDMVDSLGEGTRVTLSHQPGINPVQLTLTMCFYRDRPSMLLELHLRNRTAERLRIGELRPVDMDFTRGGSLLLGEGLASARIYQESNNIYGAIVRSVTETGSDRPEPGDSAERVHQSGWLGLIFNPQSHTTFLGGFMTVQTALGKIVTHYQPEKGITRWYAACKYDGLEIEPEGELRSEKLYIDVRPEPFQSLETFADVVVAENKLPPIKETPALWCSWYPYRLKLTEDDVLKNAQVVAQRFRDYGVKTLQLDYGWNDRDTPGNWSHNTGRFPHGLKWLVEQLQAMGLELGLWIAPFTVFEHSDFFQEHPDCVVTDSEGNPSPWQTPWPWEPKQTIYDLDVRKTESQAFLTRTFRELCSSGMTYFKMDFLNGPSAAPLSFWHGIRNEDRIRDGERMRIGLALIRKTVGDDGYLLACNLPHSHALGIVSAVFAALDGGNAYMGNEESWKHFKRRTSSLIGRYYQQKKFWHCDSDVIYVGGNPPEFSPTSDMGEARCRTTVVALSGGPVILGDNLAQLPEERLAMCSLCLPAYGVAARPVDLFTSDHPRIWDLKVKSDWGQWDVIGLFNYESQTATIPVDFVNLGLSGEKPYLAWEFWEQEFLGIQSGRIVVNVPPRNVRVLLLKELPRHPAVLSTSFHLTQGGVELSQVGWDEHQRVLSGTCHRIPGARGALIVYIPEGFEFVECRSTGNVLPAHAVAPGVWNVGLEFQERAIHWQMKIH